MEKRELIAEKEREILTLKNRLSANTSDIGDYKIIKIYEARLKGEADPYDADDIINQREEARELINQLQHEIEILENE